MKRSIMTVAASLTATVLLGGCTAATPEKQTAADSAGSKAPAVPDDGAGPEPDEGPDDGAPAKIGATSWYTYGDGLQAQVTKARRYTIGRYAAGGQPGDAGVIVSLTLKNTTDKVFDTALMSVNLASGPNGDTADSVYDSANGVSGGHEGSIAPGRSKTAEYAFAVPKKQIGDLLVEVEPSWDHASAFFEGAAK